MNKLFAIAWKDIQLILRDRAALLMILLAPWLLTLGMGFVTGAFAEDDSDTVGISDISVALINEDEGVLGDNLVELFQSEQIADLIDLEIVTTQETARTEVENGDRVAVVYIPPTFSAGILPDSETGAISDGEPIAIYSDPGAPISASVVETIINEFLLQAESGVLTVSIAMSQLIADGKLSLTDDLPGIADQIGTEIVTGSRSEQLTVNAQIVGQEPDEFNVLSYLAPSMALFFLMYTVTVGGRNILAEREDGTWDRMLTTPTAVPAMLGGKIFGIFLTGVAQLAILILGTSSMYDLQWGDGLGVIVLIAAAALAATGWGVLLASGLQTASQVSSVGSGLMLLFGIIGGSFTPVGGIVGQIGLISPNGQAINGFTELAAGGTLTDILPIIASLLLMAALLFGASTFLFQRSN